MPQAPLAALGVGARFRAQVFALDPSAVDGTFTAATDGLRVTVVP